MINDFLDGLPRDIQTCSEYTPFFVTQDHDGKPIFCRRIQGRNADSMTCHEILARGHDEITDMRNALDNHF